MTQVWFKKNKNNKWELFSGWHVKLEPHLLQHEATLCFGDALNVSSFHSLVDYVLSNQKVWVGEHRAMTHCQIHIVAMAVFLAFAKNSAYSVV